MTTPRGNHEYPHKSAVRLPRSPCEMHATGSSRHKFLALCMPRSSGGRVPAGVGNECVPNTVMFALFLVLYHDEQIPPDSSMAVYIPRF